MEQFFNPHSIVILGASTNPNKAGHRVMQNLLRYKEHNQGISLYIVHPRESQILDIPCAKDLQSIQHLDRIDLGVIVLPIPAVMPSIRELIKKNVRGIIVESGDFSNDPEEKHQFKKEIKQLLATTDIRIIGPNALGVYVPQKWLATPIAPLPKMLEARNKKVMLCGQSGLFVTSFIQEFLEEQTIGYSALAAIGNKLDVNECDIIEYFDSDNSTTAMGMYIEDIRDGPRFLQLAKKLHKPLVILKSGRSEKGKQAVSSHTGSLAGNFEVFNAVTKQFGIHLVENYTELMEMMNVVAFYQEVQGPRVGVISVSGSGCVLAADYVEQFGLSLSDVSPELRQKLRPLFPDWAPIHNPIDTWASIEVMGDQASFNQILQQFLESHEFDVIVMATMASSFSRFDYQFIQQMQSQYPEIPIILHFFGGNHLHSMTVRAFRNNIPCVKNFQYLFKFIGMLYDQNRRKIV